MNELATVDKIKNDEERLLNEIVETKGENLPANIQDVVHVFEFTDWKAKAWKTLADKMSKLEDQQEAYHSALRSGQNWGIAALYAQKRMGEITRDMPVAPGTKQHLSDPHGEVVPKAEHLKRASVSTQCASDAERIASHPDVLDRVIESAKTSNDIPTKSAVLREIRSEQAQKMKQEASQDAAIHNDRIMERKAKERPKIVADYFESIKQHREMAKLAFASAKQGMFADESLNILRKKHEELSTLYAQIEAAIGGNDNE